MAGLTYTDVLAKLKTQAKSIETSVTTQLVQDYNMGYQQLLSKLTRYWTRKQQFTDLIAGQQIYQTPVDANKVEAVTAQVTTAYKPPLKPVYSEEEWRRLTSYSMQSSWPTYYFIIGQKEIGLWPVPASSVTLGLRLVYQPRAFNLSMADITSASTSATASVTHGSTTVTLSSGVLSTSQIGLNFQATGILDDTFYDIVASSSTTVTLEAPYVGATASGVAWRVGQLPNLPSEFHDVPLHYALWLYFSAEGNESRAALHKKFFDDGTNEALARYSSAQEASVITEEVELYNPWLVPPPAA
jgi:hypothetical protein